MAPGLLIRYITVSVLVACTEKVIHQESKVVCRQNRLWLRQLFLAEEGEEADADAELEQ